ncbi:MAG: TPM domain-containing protein [Terracidiphilus sp.]|nr:TPM domain-containing protein [Terracidiphilus sp.]
MNEIRSARGLVCRLMLAALVLFCAPVVAVRAEQVKDLPKPTDYVSDYAHVLSPEAVAKIDSLCAQLDHTKANAQVAVVTVKTLDGADSAQWANELEDQWKMGRKGSDRGVLVLLAVDDHKRRIEVGYGLEGILNDAKLGDIGRAMVPYLRARDYDSAVLLAVGQVGQTIADDAGVTLTGQPVQAAPRVHQSKGIPPLLVFVLILLFFGGFGLLRLLLFLGVFSGISRGGGWGGGGPFIGGGGFGGGGGGDSGGGGFGGFGGGGFGGGGAGGDW